MLSKYFFVVFLVIFLHVSLVSSDHGRRKPLFRKCRCVSNVDKCWPSTNTWARFNRTISGQLLTVHPIITACEGNQPDMNKCDFVISQWNNASWRSDQPGALQNTNWENVSCTEEFDSLHCTQGNIPRYGVNAITPEHVMATIRFATKHNLRLVIKTTGHDYLGRSTAADSLLLWLHNMKNMTLVEDFTSCTGEKVKNVIRLTAGVQWGEVYSWLADYNLIAIGGASPTVGAVGGFLQGGGHGPLSRWQGMGADQVLEFDVVTADGIRRRINSCQHSDLFFALRGGGGGTFGVVLSAVLRTYSSPSISCAITTVKAESDQDFQRYLHDFIRILPDLSSKNWSGYFYIADHVITIAFLVPNGNHTENLESYNQLLVNTTGLEFVRKDQLYFPSFYDFFRDILSSANPSGGQVLIGSRLIPEYVVRQQGDVLARTLFQLRGNTINESLLVGHLVAGQRVSTIDTNTSVNPAWRTALLSMIYTRGWPDGSSNNHVNSVKAEIRKSVNILDTVAGGSQSGCYLNEADPDEPNWQQKFFGSWHLYNRLKKIKRKFDPKGLFICKNCVGSDDWNEELNCRKTMNTEPL